MAVSNSCPPSGVGSVVEREVNGIAVRQRAGDGYVNATQLCKAAGKLFADYRRTRETQDFLAELEVNMGIPISTLIESRKGGSEVGTNGGG